MRIGIFGGTFDPVHLGHLILAEHCREQALLDQIWFVPCARQPLKDRAITTTDRQRSEMIEMAIAGCDPFHLSKLELERGGVSYTVDTLEQIISLQPAVQLFLLMGRDSLQTFEKWKSPERVCELSIPLIANRPGSDVVDLSPLRPYASDARFREFESYSIRSPLIEISSTDLRGRIANRQSIRYLVPRAVEKYIETHQLYSPLDKQPKTSPD
jgi:nicotinate-nucleotide adenylyltransferase